MVINIIRNPEKAPYCGNRFAQDVEPAGIYVIKCDDAPDGWLKGIAHLQKPLFINVFENSLIEWKRHLALKYRAKKHRLSEKIMNEGYDSIVTVKENGEWGEIVLLSNTRYYLS